MPSTRILQNALVVGAFAAFCIAGMFFMATSTGQRYGPLPIEYNVAFDVKDADGLPEGGDVRIAGIPVGKVEAVKASGEGARVVMGIFPQYQPLYTDATVLIRPKSLLGEKYVDATRGTSNVPIEDGGTIPVTQAFTQVELDQVLQSSDAQTRQALSVNIQTLGQGLQGNGSASINPTIPTLRAIAEHLTPVSARFKDRTAQIDHIMVDTDTILSTLADEHQQLATLLQSADSVLGTVSDNDQHLANILTAGSDTIARLDVAFAQQNNDQNIRYVTEQSPQALSHLNTFLDATNHNIDTLVPSLLLGNQYNYPNDQLTITEKSALTLAAEWDSGFRIYDPASTPPAGTSGPIHGFMAMGVQCNDGSSPLNSSQPGSGYQTLCPGDYLKQGNTPSSRAQSSVSPEAEQALLAYLLGQ